MTSTDNDGEVTIQLFLMFEDELIIRWLTENGKISPVLTNDKAVEVAYGSAMLHLVLLQNCYLDKMPEGTKLGICSADDRVIELIDLDDIRQRVRDDYVNTEGSNYTIRVNAATMASFRRYLESRKDEDVYTAIRVALRLERTIYGHLCQNPDNAVCVQFDTGSIRRITN